jgi:hypothetical protein
LKDSDRKISVREWIAFVGSWNLLKNVKQGASGAKRKGREKGKNVDDGGDSAEDASFTPPLLLEEESSSVVVAADGALNNGEEETIILPNMRKKSLAAASARPRKSSRLLPVRPVRRLTIWEAKRIFSTIVARRSLPTFGLALSVEARKKNKNRNKTKGDGVEGETTCRSGEEKASETRSSPAELPVELFAMFDSWNEKKNNRIIVDERSRHSEVGLTSKGFVEALCTVAVYQQPSPYYSLDQSLEYLLQNVMAGKIRRMAED